MPTGMSFLHEPGDLARTPLAAILLEALNLRATGVLTVQHGGGASRLFIKEGTPVGAQVVAGIRPLGHVLLQEGAIDIDTLSRSLALMAESRRPQGEILVEMGAVSPEQVERALAEQQAGYFDLIAALESGAYQFDSAAQVPAWANRRLLSPLRTIVDALERPQAGALVISALQPVASATLRLASGYQSVASAFRWTPRERVLVARLESPATLEAFLAPSDVSPERARAMVAGLLLLGLAVAAGETPHPTGETGAGLDLELDVPQRPGGATPPPSSPTTGPARRSDPAEARARRQRLLQQAMRNMGIGPFAALGRSTPPPVTSAPPPTPVAPGPGPRRPDSPRDPLEASLRRALLGAVPRSRERDLFARLGLPVGASREEVKHAFLGLARQFHPDRFTVPALADLADTVREFFAAVNEAYETLSDEKKRNAYLSRGEGGGGAQDPQSARIDFTKGEACLRTRDWVKARGFFEAAIRADPQPDYKAALALAIIRDPGSRDRERARALVEEALRTPSCDRAAYVGGILARDDKEVGKAEKLFRAAVAANPRNADAARELRLLERRRAR